MHTFIQTTASYSDDDHRSMLLDGIVCHGKSKSFSLVQNLIFSSSSSSRRVKKLRQINICQSCTILRKMVSFPLYSNIQISIFWINFINESFCMSTQIRLTFLIKLLKSKKRKIVNSPWHIFIWFLRLIENSLLSSFYLYFWIITCDFFREKYIANGERPGKQGLLQSLTVNEPQIRFFSP